MAEQMIPPRKWHLPAPGTSQLGGKAKTVDKRIFSLRILVRQTVTRSNFHLSPTLLSAALLFYCDNSKRIYKGSTEIKKDLKNESGTPATAFWSVVCSGSRLKIGQAFIDADISSYFL